MSKTINKITREDVRKFSQMVGYADSVDPAGNVADLYQTIAGQSAVYPGQGTPLGLIYCALKLNGEAGEFAEHVGKAMRDDGFAEVGTVMQNDERGMRLPITGLHGKLTPERAEKLDKELGDILWYVARAVAERGKTLSDIMLSNLEKLADRTERDTLRGSGDDR